MPIEIADPLELHAADLVNAARAEAGLAPVHVEVHLNHAAQGHSDWMSEQGVLSHQGAEGSTPAERAADADFPLEGGRWTLTENVAYRSIDGSPDMRDVENLHDALMASEGHRANILDPDVDYIGIGLSVGQLEFGRGHHDVLYLTQNFASTSQPVLVQEEIDGEAFLTTYVEGEPVDGSSEPVEPTDHDEETEQTPEDEQQDGTASPSTAGGACFVATAAFGDPGHPDVAMLRRLRDEVLVRSAAGRAFIRTYWRIGPRLARIVRADGLSGRAARAALQPAVALAARVVAARGRRNNP